MPPLKKGEILTPLRGLCDTIVSGEGLIDMCSYEEEDGTIKTGFNGEYIDITLSFTDEGEGEYAEIQLSNRASSLKPLDLKQKIDLRTMEEVYPEGVTPMPTRTSELEDKIIRCSELLLEILREKIRRGGKYGGERSYQLFNIKNA